MISTVEDKQAPAKRRVDWTARVTATCTAPAETVYEIVSDLQSHPRWNGPRRPGGHGMLTMDAPTGPGIPGTEFRSTGSEPEGIFSDRSVVTQAVRPRLFEYVTDARAVNKAGRQTTALTAVYRYEVEPTSAGSVVTFEGHFTEFAGELTTVMALPGLGQVALWVVRRALRRGLTGLVSAAEERQANVVSK